MLTCRWRWPHALAWLTPTTRQRYRRSSAVMSMNPPRAIAPFALTDHLGKAPRLEQFAGAPTLVFFGFTHCPDVCPTTLQRLAQQSSALGDIRVVMISVDGERDTPVLA